MEERWATVWGHIEDLRQTLLRTLCVAGIGFLILLCFHQPILNILSASYLNSANQDLLVQSVEYKKVSNQSGQNKLFLVPNDAVVAEEIPVITEGDNSFILLAPGETLHYHATPSHPLLILGPLDGVLLVVKVCVWLSLVLTAPFWGWIWFQFIYPGLRKEERMVFVSFLSLSVLSVLGGIAFAYLITVPIANQYLNSFNLSIGQNAWTLNHYVDFLFFIGIGHAIAAEIGLLLLVLVHFRFLSPNWLKEKRRYMIVLVFIFSAILTPPDVISQLLLAFPLLLLYELAIVYAKWRTTSLLHE